MPNLAPSVTAHAHAADLDACLDFVNTVELTDGRPADGLVAESDALLFLADHGLGHEEDLRRQARRDGARWLARIHETRAALRDLWDAQVEGRSPRVASLGILNSVLERSPRVELRATPGGIEVSHRHPGDDPTGEALSRLVSPLVDALATGKTDRFRICANDGCRWVFEDTSRAGRRRWCDMTTCGNRAKVRRFRSKVRDPQAGESVPPSRKGQ